MSEHRVTFNEDQNKRIRDAVQWYERKQPHQRPQSIKPRFTGGSDGHLYAVVYGSSIPAADDEGCPGVGEVKTFRHDVGGEEATGCLLETDNILEVFNPRSEAYQFGDIVMIHKERTGHKWWIVPTGDGSQIIHYELIDALPFGGSALAHKLVYDGSSWEIDADADPVRVIDWYGNMWSGGEEYRGLAVERGDSNSVLIGEEYVTIIDYDIVWQQQVAETIEFTTTQYMGENTDPGEEHQVNATVDSYDNQGMNPGSTVIVYDPAERFLDVGVGAKGSAKYDYIQGIYIIVDCQRLVMWAEVTLNSDVDMCGTGVSLEEDCGTITYRPISLFVTEPDENEDSVINPAGHHACGGDTIYLRRYNDDPHATIWRVEDAPKKSISVLTDFRIHTDVSGTHLQFKPGTIIGEQCNCDSLEWETYHTGIDCPPPEE